MLKYCVTYDCIENYILCLVSEFCEIFGKSVVNVCTKTSRKVPRNAYIQGLLVTILSYHCDK